jgi:hypothetical protein
MSSQKAIATKIASLHVKFELNLFPDNKYIFSHVFGQLNKMDNKLSLKQAFFELK